MNRSYRLSIHGNHVSVCVLVIAYLVSCLARRRILSSGIGPSVLNDNMRRAALIRQSHPESKKGTQQ